MGDLSGLQLLLYLVLILELVLFFIMNGSDFGIGISTVFAKGEKQKSTLLRAPGAVLYGNETWFVVAMATMFGAFPRWLASVASGFYLLFIFALLFLMLRAFSLNYRTRWKSATANSLMDVFLFLGSLLPPFFLTMVFASSLQGVPLTNEIVQARFFDIVTPFTVWSGITMVLMCWSVGLARVIKFVDGDLKEKLRRRARTILYILFAAIVVEVVLLFVFTQVLTTHPLPTFFFISLIATSLISALFLSARHMDRLNFWVLMIPIFSLLAIIFVGLFPYVIIDTGGNSLSLAASVSGYESQLWVAGTTAIMFPLMILGQIVAFYYLNKYYAVPDTDINS